MVSRDNRAGIIEPNWSTFRRNHFSIISLARLRRVINIPSPSFLFFQRFTEITNLHFFITPPTFAQTSVRSKFKSISSLLPSLPIVKKNAQSLSRVRITIDSHQ